MMTIHLSPSSILLLAKSLLLGLATVLTGLWVVTSFLYWRSAMPWPGEILLGVVGTLACLGLGWYLAQRDKTHETIASLRIEDDKLVGVQTTAGHAYQVQSCQCHKLLRYYVELRLRLVQATDVGSTRYHKPHTTTLSVCGDMLAAHDLSRLRQVCLMQHAQPRQGLPD